MKNIILIIIVLIVCIMYIINTIRKNDLWDEEKTLYTNLFSLRAFIMSIIFGILAILILLKG